jgi:two-component system sensor histidine kinase BaeS
MARRRGTLLGPLGWRLFAAFLLVGVGAVALLAALAAASVRGQTTSLLASQRDQARHDIAAALAAAYTQAGSWAGIDLSGAQALAQSTGAQLVILNEAGGRVATVTPAPAQDHQPGHDASHAPGHDTSGGATHAPGHDTGSHGSGGDNQRAPQPSGTHQEAAGRAPATAAEGSAVLAAAEESPAPGATTSTATATSAALPAAADQVPVVADGKTVGTVVITFPPASQSAAWQARDAILQTVGLGAVAAVALAAAAALLVSRRTTRPLTALAAAAGAVGRGEPDAEKLLRPGPGELGQVSAAFAAMARSLRHEDQLRRDMVADIAHELRTPVTILQGGTEELLDGIADPTPGKLTSLHDETLRLGRLVDDLATLAAAQAAALTLHKAPADLGKIAVAAAEALAPQLDEAGLRLNLDSEPAVVSADEARITQVTVNLLTNAVKYTPPGGQVTVTTRAEDGAARLTVADTGPGIPAADLPHVFERFWRGAGAKTRSGAGIGLAVVAELAAAHGGTVTAASPPGSGAVFTVTLPAT